MLVHALSFLILIEKPLKPLNSFEIEQTNYSRKITYPRSAMA